MDDKTKAMFRYKGKHILYFTGEVQREEENPPPKEEIAEANETKEELSAEQMKIVLGSMSDNRISDSVKDLVAKNAT